MAEDEPDRPSDRLRVDWPRLEELGAVAPDTARLLRRTSMVLGPRDFLEEPRESTVELANASWEDTVAPPMEAVDLLPEGLVAPVDPIARPGQPIDVEGVVGETEATMVPEARAGSPPAGPPAVVTERTTQRPPSTIQVRIVKPTDLTIWLCHEPVEFEAMTVPPGYEHLIMWEVPGSQDQVQQRGYGPRFACEWERTGVKQVKASIPRVGPNMVADAGGTVTAFGLGVPVALASAAGDEIDHGFGGPVGDEWPSERGGDKDDLLLYLYEKSEQPYHFLTPRELQLGRSPDLQRAADAVVRRIAGQAPSLSTPDESRSFGRIFDHAVPRADRRPPTYEFALEDVHDVPIPREAQVIDMTPVVEEGKKELSERLGNGVVEALQKAAERAPAKAVRGTDRVDVIRLEGGFKESLELAGRRIPTRLEPFRKVRADLDEYGRMTLRQFTDQFSERAAKSLSENLFTATEAQLRLRPELSTFEAQALLGESRNLLPRLIGELGGAGLDYFTRGIDVVSRLPVVGWLVKQRKLFNLSAGGEPLEEEIDLDDPINLFSEVEIGPASGPPSPATVAGGAARQALRERIGAAIRETILDETVRRGRGQGRGDEELEGEVTRLVKGEVGRVGRRLGEALDEDDIDDLVDEGVETIERALEGRSLYETLREEYGLRVKLGFGRFPLKLGLDLDTFGEERNPLSSFVKEIEFKPSIAFQVSAPIYARLKLEPEVRFPMPDDLDRESFEEALRELEAGGDVSLTVLPQEVGRWELSGSFTANYIRTPEPNQEQLTWGFKMDLRISLPGATRPPSRRPYDRLPEWKRRLKILDRPAPRTTRQSPRPRRRTS